MASTHTANVLVGCLARFRCRIGAASMTQQARKRQWGNSRQPCGHRCNIQKVSLAVDVLIVENIKTRNTIQDRGRLVGGSASETVSRHRNHFPINSVQRFPATLLWYADCNYAHYLLRWKMVAPDEPTWQTECAAAVDSQRGMVWESLRYKGSR